jgi:hypothetical protein
MNKKNAQRSSFMNVIEELQDNTKSKWYYSEKKEVIFEDQIEENLSKLNFKAVKNTATIGDKFNILKKETFSDNNKNKVADINHYYDMLGTLDQKIEKELKE